MSSYKQQSFANFLLQKDTNGYTLTQLLISFSYTIKSHFYRFSSFIFGQLSRYLPTDLLGVQEFIKHVGVLRRRQRCMQIIPTPLPSVQTPSWLQFVLLLTFFPSLIIFSGARSSSNSPSLCAGELHEHPG